ncbi:MAG TPA: hypothetical protein VG456_12535 [Candidatus Sulfopaludibacter sp.]|jgi:hypothetical protein|nr:hypothetical protein [Candidatus Sulfopaludibacter sp.]
MIYTSYEMVQDCRAGKPEGWAYFISNYVPLVRKLAAHYGGADSVDRILLSVRKADSNMFQAMEPVPERWFIAELRQKVLAEIPLPSPEIELDLETVSAAFEPLTLVEKQVAWIETMGYDAAQTGAMMRMAPKTVEKIRERASELLRGKLDTWRRGVLTENGRLLSEAATAAAGKDCLPVKVFLDILDGRTTWYGRETMEQHVLGCWHCIDHFSRMVEVVELIRGVQPLTETEAAPYRQLLGIQTARRPFWKRVMNRGY